MKLANYVMGDWVEGAGAGAALIDPSTGAELARASSEGVDLGAALEHARRVGGPALRAMSYGERAAMLRAAAEVLAANRDAYFATAQANSGNTQIDATIDVDGGIGTLKYYAAIGKGLGEARILTDGGLERLGKDESFQALHVSVPIRGVAIHERPQIVVVARAPAALAVKGVQREKQAPARGRRRPPVRAEGRGDHGAFRMNPTCLEHEAVVTVG